MSKISSESAFPPFPKNIFHGLAKKFVDLYSPIREAPEEFFGAAFITYLGNALSPYVRMGSVEPRLFTVLIGQSARTRKSSSMQEAVKIFQAAPQRTIAGFGSAEGLLSLMAAEEKTRITPVVAYLDEMNILASKTQISGSVGISAFNTLFENHDYEHRLAGERGFVLKNAYLSLLGASTREDFINSWAGQSVDAGFFSRLIYILGDISGKSFPVVHDPDPQGFQTLVNEIAALLAEVQANPISFTMDSEAKNLWTEFYVTFGDGKEWDRIDTYASRLMVIQAILRGEKSISIQTVRDVIQFSQYQVAVRRMVTPVVAENKQAELEERIRRYIPVGCQMAERTLRRGVNADRYGVENFRKALAALIANEELSKPIQVGRSRVYIHLEEAEEENVIKNDDDAQESHNIPIMCDLRQ